MTIIKVEDNSYVLVHINFQLNLLFDYICRGQNTKILSSCITSFSQWQMLKVTSKDNVAKSAS